MGTEAKEVRSCEDLASVDALILPGGESTVMMKLLEHGRLDRMIINRVRSGMPIFGTCAGAILLSYSHLKLMDISVDRNAYGPQLRSFTEDIMIRDIGEVHASFIRAPKIIRTGTDVLVLALSGDDPVLVRERNILASTFHSELEACTQIHAYFLQFCMRESAPMIP